MHEPIDGACTDEVAVLGGKGASLVRMARLGLPVPGGHVLTTAFFAPWFDQLRASPQWAALVEGGPGEWSRTCPLVQAFEPVLDSRQAEVLSACEEPGLVAVRSSSPEEDLAGASFAGGYETRLGVAAGDLEEAVRACFASSVAERVLHYKLEHGFDPLQPRIAVVVQRQLHSEVAGVAFSLNPLSNDYDEVVIEAAWGLGESVVAGLTEPDHVVVDRVSCKVREHRIGSKERSLWLADDGGQEVREGWRSAESCLTDAQIRELVGLVVKVEGRFEQPVDVEWAWADGALHVLQARPVTAWVPLPHELRTAPGERRRLLMDASLSNGLTLNVPVSPLGLDWLVEVFMRLLERFVGPIERGEAPSEALFFGAGGRLYADLSQLLWIQSPAMLKRGNQGVDALMADTLGNIDAKRYRSARRPKMMKLRYLWRVPRMVWASRHVVARLVATVLAPAWARRRYDADIASLESDLRSPLDPARSVHDELGCGFDALYDRGFPALWAGLIAGMTPILATDALVGGLDRALAMRLQQGFDGNVVLRMGAQMASLAARLPLSDPELAERIEASALPPDLQHDWDAWMAEFGSRGPTEMDLASPRYGDDVRLVLAQLRAMVGSDPAAAHQRLMQQRREAFRQLWKRSVWRALLLWWPHRLAERFAGTRDTPKHVLTAYNHRMRRRALVLGRELVAEGRLDRPEQVFDLHLHELHAPGDLRSRCVHNRRFLDELRQLDVAFPPVIDTRGRILRPRALPEVPGQLRGMGVSVGVARGRVRKLRHATQGGIEPGDVLLAYTTDPGWTPLFVNAAAIVLEIGGTLQHGALVAREYGKPCVVGISRLFDRLDDGQLVEVDGTSGVVRIIDETR
ncbi:MAG: hypothetical protein KTR31_40265 [Myxococcales bacterium]|nr:hypothetical protein [Myxococcales bacterium]